MTKDVPIERVAKALSFTKATKMSVVYEYEPNYKKKKANTFAFYLEDAPMTLTTVVDGNVETTHTVSRGDVILTGGLKEQWAMTMPEFIERYNVIETAAMTRPVHRFVAEVPNAVFTKFRLPIPYYFTAPWKERMTMEPGDYLVKDGRGYYRVARKAFFKTYLVNV
jgi:hypothetical protein